MSLVPLKNLTDTFGRFHNYLRIALLEKCNLRCVYCMPEKGIDLTPKDKMLSTPELLRLVNIFGNAGVSKIRLTGGEPSIMRDLIPICQDIKAHPNINTLAMTSNGIILHKLLPDLKNAGMDALNISLDTLVPAKFEFITRRKGHNLVMKSITNALDMEFKSVKVNIVVMRNQNEDEINDFVAMTRDQNLNVRFIEYMPFDDNKWTSDKTVSYFEMKDIIEKKYGKLTRKKDHPSETAKNYTLEGLKGSVSFISNNSVPFCAGCNRIRLLSDGGLKICLFDNREVSLRDAMRSGFTDEEILQVINNAILKKKQAHAGLDVLSITKNRPMIKIGG